MKLRLWSIETIYPTTRLKWFEMALLNSVSQTVCFPSRRLVEPTRSLGTASCLLWTLEQDAPASHGFILIRMLFCRHLQTFVSLCVDVWRHSSSCDGLPLFQAEGNMNVTQHNKINKKQQSICKTKRNESVKPKKSLRLHGSLCLNFTLRIGRRGL